MSPRIALHNWMRPEPIEATAARAKRHGYDAIELAGEPAQYDVALVRAALESHGLACSAVLTVMTAGRDLSSEDPYVRRGTVTYVKETIDLAAALGARCLTLVPTTVGKLAPMASATHEWGWCVDSLRFCNAHAEERGVRLALEPLNRFETYLLHRAEQALTLADAVGDYCGVCLDTFHMNIEEAHWREALRACGDRLLNLHAADNNRLAPGQGTIDWSVLLAELDALSYGGWVAVEFVPPPSDRTRLEPEPVAGDEQAPSASAEQFMRDHAGSWLGADDYERLVALSIQTLRDAQATAVPAGG